MSAIKEAKLTLEEVSQEIDLKQALGEQPSYVYQSAAQDLIDYMVKRVSGGKGVEENKVTKLKKPYSESYQQSLEFKAYGKEKNKINMKLTGNMLDSIDVIESSDGVVKIGIDDPEEAAKAYNHQTGDTVPKRPFFGVTESDISKIKKIYKKEFKPSEQVKDIMDAIGLFDKPNTVFSTFNISNPLEINISTKDLFKKELGI